jgi:hypothetical protein
VDPTVGRSVALTVVPEHGGEGRVDAARLSGASTWRRSEASVWRMSEAPTWRHTRRTQRRVRGGGHMVEVEAEEEWAPTGMWWENDRVRV